MCCPSRRRTTDALNRPPKCWLTHRKVYVSALITGLVLLTLGIILLAANNGARSPFLDRVKDISTHYANNVGFDLFAASVFVTAFGLGFTNAGIAGLRKVGLCNKHTIH